MAVWCLYMALWCLYRRHLPPIYGSRASNLGRDLFSGFGRSPCPDSGPVILAISSVSGCICNRKNTDCIMSTNRVQSAFIEAGERRMLLCDPPAGSFDKDSPALKWVQGGYSSTQYHSVYIPTQRYPDFLAGEGTRAGCAMYVQKHEKAKGQKGAEKVGWCLQTLDLALSSQMARESLALQAAYLLG